MYKLKRLTGKSPLGTVMVPATHANITFIFATFMRRVQAFLLITSKKCKPWEKMAVFSCEISTVLCFLLVLPEDRFRWVENLIFTKGSNIIIKIILLIGKQVYYDKFTYDKFMKSPVETRFCYLLSYIIFSTQVSLHAVLWFAKCLLGKQFLAQKLATGRFVKEN